MNEAEQLGFRPPSKELAAEANMIVARQDDKKNFVSDKAMLAHIKAQYPELKARYNTEWNEYQATLNKTYENDCGTYCVAKPHVKVDQPEARQEFVAGCDAMCFQNTMK